MYPTLHPPLHGGCMGAAEATMSRGWGLCSSGAKYLPFPFYMLVLLLIASLHIFPPLVRPSYSSCSHLFSATAA